MKQVFVSGQGQIDVLDVPAPLRGPGAVLVRTRYSLISSGTEGAAVTSHAGLLGALEKARRSPAKVERVWKLARTQGVLTTWEMLRNKLADLSPLGYSAAGTVIEVDDPGGPFRIGDQVACMGAGVANHAEYLVVPRNLALPLPTGVAADQAAFGAVACIAMQGIRRLEAQPGEWIGVIGLGLIGQVSVRLLQAMGYRVCATDLLKGRVELASTAGVPAWPLNGVDSLGRVQELTGGRGLDGVVVCAATPSDEPVNLAFDICRPRGKVSIVGDVGLGLQRDKMYRKELELRMSTSYGPGRYDPEYELEGRDYPYGLVRWTSRRNLEHFLQLLADRRLDLAPLLSATYGVSQAGEAYARVKQGSAQDYGILFDYGSPGEEPPARVLRSSRQPAPQGGGSGAIRLGLIGVGNYAKAIHLPNLKSLSGRYTLAGVASRSGATAAVVARRYSIPLVSSDYRELLADPHIEAVLISTRHASHASIALAALEAGKHVFVEKPLATTLEDAAAVGEAVDRSGRVLRVGFNRRFSPWLVPLREALGTSGRRTVSIRVNVGNLGDHWSNAADEGGRLLGEGVHFFDLANWLLDQTPIRVSAEFAGAPSISNPNCTVQVGYPDGSAAVILYTTLGAPGMGKEYVEVFGNGHSGYCDDYRELKSFGVPVRGGARSTGDKGQRGALEEFASAVRATETSIRGADASAGLLATWMALAAYASATTGTSVTLPPTAEMTSGVRP